MKRTRITRLLSTLLSGSMALTSACDSEPPDGDPDNIVPVPGAVGTIYVPATADIGNGLNTTLYSIQGGTCVDGVGENLTKSSQVNGSLDFEVKQDEASLLNRFGISTAVSASYQVFSGSISAQYNSQTEQRDVSAFGIVEGKQYYEMTHPTAPLQLKPDKLEILYDTSDCADPASQACLDQRVGEFLVECGNAVVTGEKRFAYMWGLVSTKSRTRSEQTDARLALMAAFGTAVAGGSVNVMAQNAVTRARNEYGLKVRLIWAGFTPPEGAGDINNLVGGGGSSADNNNENPGTARATAGTNLNLSLLDSYWTKLKSDLQAEFENNNPGASRASKVLYYQYFPYDGLITAAIRSCGLDATQRGKARAAATALRDAIQRADTAVTAHANLILRLRVAKAELEAAKNEPTKWNFGHAGAEAPAEWSSTTVMTRSNTLLTTINGHLTAEEAALAACRSSVTNGFNQCTLDMAYTGRLRYMDTEYDTKRPRLIDFVLPPGVPANQTSGVFRGQAEMACSDVRNFQNQSFMTLPSRTQAAVLGPLFEGLTFYNANTVWATDRPCTAGMTSYPGMGLRKTNGAAPRAVCLEGVESTGTGASVICVPNSGP